LIESNKDKLRVSFLFTNHFKHEEASTYSAPLDLTIRFLNETLLTSGQYRATDAIDPMLKASAIINNASICLMPQRQKNL
jgi:hypothetical protein